MTGFRWTAAHDDAWLALALVRGLPPRKALELVEDFGDPREVLTAAPGRLRAAGVAADVARELREGLRRAAEERAAVTRVGGHVVTWGSDAYPARLREIAAPPLALFARGTLGPPDEVAVAIVGARRASEYGRRVAEELGRGLALAGVTVVSGLATGIDAAAHRGALAAGGRTLAVMATGIDGVYPTWHRELARDVAASGALFTEFPTGTAPLQFHFPRRNRIISGVSLGVVVVEAAERSGSLITADFAVEQGREVFAVPGPVGTAQHRGCHRLIRQGATLVTSVEDVLAEIAPSLATRLVAARAEAAAADLAPEERAVLGTLATDVLHVDRVATLTQLPAARTLETLLALELRGLVAQRPGMRFTAGGAARGAL